MYDGVHGKLIESAMALAAERGWQPLTLAEIAQFAGLGPDDMPAEMGGKDDVLVALLHRLDAAALDAGRAGYSEQDTPRDRLFDVIMERLEMLQPYRAGIRAVYRALGRDPMALARWLPRLQQSMAWTLEAAGVASDGLRGAMLTQGLGLLSREIFEVWLNEEEAGLPRTMAELDQKLRRAEERFAPIDRLGRGLGRFWERAA